MSDTTTVHNEHACDIASIVFDNILNRRSVRRYRKEVIVPEVLEKILAAGHAAPSAGNLKSREFIVLTTQEEIDSVLSYIFSARVMEQKSYFRNAGALILMCANPTRSKQKYKRGRLYAMQDATLAGQNMLLMATALGLGSCWIGQVREKGLMTKFNISPELHIVGIVALGHKE
jgi:nitroreductase